MERISSMRDRVDRVTAAVLLVAIVAVIAAALATAAPREPAYDAARTALITEEPSELPAAALLRGPLAL
jgi:hypothetical protein